jgi:hypothetical protein
MARICCGFRRPSSSEDSASRSSSRNPRATRSGLPAVLLQRDPAGMGDAGADVLDADDFGGLEELLELALAAHPAELAAGPGLVRGAGRGCLSRLGGCQGGNQQEGGGDRSPEAHGRVLQTHIRSPGGFVIVGALSTGRRMRSDD